MIHSHSARILAARFWSSQSAVAKNLDALRLYEVWRGIIILAENDDSQQVRGQVKSLLFVYRESA